MNVGVDENLNSYVKVIRRTVIGNSFFYNIF